jgi:acetyltransferase-like isoleucine patch superfamily enzyme
MEFFVKIYNKLDLYLVVLVERLVSFIPYFDFVNGTKEDQNRITFGMWWRQTFFSRQYRWLYWPIHPSSEVSYGNRILIGVDTCPGLMPGCYLHGINGIIIGDYTQISANVGIQSGNHDLHDLRKQVKTEKPIKIGSYCLIAMNAIILPEVELGDFTIVGAGAVVTKSFPEGHCVLVGNPARKLRDLNKEECIRHKQNKEFIGFISKEKFPSYRKKKLLI